MENKSYEKTILWSATFLSLFALAACSNSKSSEDQTKKKLLLVLKLPQVQKLAIVKILLLILRALLLQAVKQIPIILKKYKKVLRLYLDIALNRLSMHA